MRATLAAVLVLSTSIAPARAAGFELSPDAVFLGALGAARLDALRGLKDSGLAAKAADAVPAAEVERRVLAHLAGSGVPVPFVHAAFGDPDTRLLPEVLDRFKGPAEALPYEKYRRIFMTDARILAGREFLLDRRALLDAVGARYGVDAGVLAALMGVETFYGRGTGTFDVFNALFTVASGYPPRAAWAEGELAAYLRLAWRENTGTHGLKGSYAGAFGFFQFLPSSFNAYAVDLDGDGRRRWDEWGDVLASAANFLVGHGYRPGGDYSEGSANRGAVWGYNPHENYVRVVLELRQALLAPPTPTSP